MITPPMEVAAGEEEAAVAEVLPQTEPAQTEPARPGRRGAAEQEKG